MKSFLLAGVMCIGLLSCGDAGRKDGVTSDTTVPTTNNAPATQTPGDPRPLDNGGTNANQGAISTENSGDTARGTKDSARRQ